MHPPTPCEDPHLKSGFCGELGALTGRHRATSETPYGCTGGPTRAAPPWFSFVKASQTLKIQNPSEICSQPELCVNFGIFGIRPPPAGNTLQVCIKAAACTLRHLVHRSWPLGGKNHRLRNNASGPETGLPGRINIGSPAGLWPARGYGVKSNG